MMISEDGTGTPGANSYATLAQAADYHAARLNTAWTDEDDATQAAKLILATDYIEARFPAPGARLSPGQGLQWPTAGTTAVPAAIVAATILLASYALKGPLIAPAERGTSKSTKKLEGVGELMTEYDAAPSDPYPAITAMLAPLVARPSGGALIMGRLTR